MTNWMKINKTILATAAACAAAMPLPAALVDEKSEEVLRNLAASVVSANALQAQITIKSTMAIQGQSNTNTGVITVAAVRPNKYARTMTAENGHLQEVVLSDGTEMYYFLGMAEAYDVKSAPKDMQEIFEEDELATITIHGPLLAGGYEGVDQAFDKFQYLGEEKLGEVDVHVLDFERLNAKGKLYVTTGETPAPARITVQMRTQPVKYEFDFVKWDTAGPLPDQAFTFRPPQDARKVASVTQELHKMYAKQAEPAVNPLVGKPAPAFSLEKLDGKIVSLSDHKGKDVVVLDFWATWCGPCRKGLPIATKVSSEFEDKNVVLYAVNLRESKHMVERFFKGQDYSPTVLLDKTASVGTQYGAEGIPFTVIIGKDGTVQAVHEGLSPVFEEKLRKQLASLVEGKSLLNKTTEPAGAE